jgi:predicted dehydrogenase
MLRAAVVGLGWWGRHICTSLRDSNVIRVVHGVDPATDAAAPFAEEHGFPLSAQFADVLADPQVQAVILATPHSQHVEQILAAAAAGRHVFCEKPLALTLAGAKRAVAACREAGVVLSVGHERRFELPLIELKRLVTTGALGTVLQVEANYGHNMLAAVDPGHWRASAAESPGAGLTGIGSHIIDAYTNIFGPVAEVRALSAQRATQRAGGDVLSVQFRFVSGAFGYLGNSSASPFYGRITAYGSNGWAESRARQHMQAAGGTELAFCGKDGVPSVREWGPIDTVRANLEAFATAVIGDTPNPYQDTQMVHAVAVLEAIVRSIASTRPEPVL